MHTINFQSKRLPLKNLVKNYQLDTDLLNTLLIDIILKEKQQQQGLLASSLNTPQSNIGGWHSQRDFHLWNHEPIQTLFSLIFSCASDYLDEAHKDRRLTAPNSYDWDCASWVNFLPQHSYNAPHTHPGSQISGCYYIKVPKNQDFPLSGRFDFIEDCVEYGISPEESSLLIFPSNLLHWVHPNQSCENRISVSFNLSCIMPIRQ